MQRSLLAGAIYFAVVFAAGFVLGAIRTLVIAPRVGPLAAVALELPLMLLVSRASAGTIVHRLRVPDTPPDRLAMGIVGFLLLQVAEAALGIWGFGRSLQEMIANWATAVGLLGLAGQIAFGAMPVMVRRRSKPI